MDGESRILGMSTTPNKTLDRMTRSAVSRVFQCGRPCRAPRHRSAAERGLVLTQPCLSRQVFYGSRRLAGAQATATGLELPNNAVNLAASIRGDARIGW